MEKLNCSVGSLAMVVKSSLLVNHGTIVYIQSAKGDMAWQHSKMPLFTWNVVVATLGKKLVYGYGSKTMAYDFGPVADCALIPITPPKKIKTNQNQLKLGLSRC